MTQLTLGDLAAHALLPELTDESSLAMFRAMEAVAGSTLLEFDSALAWGQWCRRTASAAIAAARRRGAAELA